VAEGCHDEFGLVWPREISPADVHVVATGKAEEVFAKSAELSDALAARGIQVIYDDRMKVSPGVKFKDAELIGVPTIVIVGKGLEAGTIEIKDRATGDRREIPVDQIVDAVVAEVRGSDVPVSGSRDTVGSEAQGAAS
jgi:prolyl-tRNA synthetase